MFGQCWLTPPSLWCLRPMPQPLPLPPPPPLLARSSDHSSRTRYGRFVISCVFPLGPSKLRILWSKRFFFLSRAISWRRHYIWALGKGVRCVLKKGPQLPPGWLQALHRSSNQRTPVLARFLAEAYQSHDVKILKLSVDMSQSCHNV